MTYDRTLLSMMKFRTDYDALVGSIDFSIQNKEVSKLLKDFGHYFAEFPESDAIQPDPFMTWLFQFKRNGAKEEERKQVQTILEAIQAPVETDIRNGIARKIKEREFATLLANSINDYRLGKNVDLSSEVGDLMFKYSATLSRTTADYDDESFESILQKNDELVYLPWRISCLNSAMGGAALKRQIIIGAEPDSGKTTFICSEATNMAAFAWRYYKGKRPVLILSNEGDVNAVRYRAFQSGVGLSNAQIAKDHALASSLYQKAMGCSADEKPLRVVNANGFSIHDAERIIQRINPCAVFWDMLDNFKGFESATRNDLRLEYLYQWTREKADQYDFVSIATSQIKGEFAGVTYPTMYCLAESNKGKQGACDTIVTFTRNAETDRQKEAGIQAFKSQKQTEAALAGIRFSRFIGTPKQKIPHPERGARKTSSEVEADFNRARIESPQGGTF